MANVAMSLSPPTLECEVIQPAAGFGLALSLDLAPHHPTPLILIHDGGGTTFAYHCLSPLGRPVYGIANPRFESGRPWEGGIPEMADTYVAMVRKTVSSPDFPKGPAAATPAKARVILGGWSLGGLLALQMTKLLEGDADVEVVGILMVDTPCPVGWGDAKPPGGKKLASVSSDDEEQPLRETEKLARRAIRAAGEMIGRWELPTWDWDEDRDKPGQVKTHQQHRQHQTEQGAQRSTDGASSSLGGVPRLPQVPPPTLLLKADESSPTRSPDEISPVDLHRDDECLGWDQYHPGFVARVIRLEGNHFDIFSWDRLTATTDKIKDACRLLDP